MKIVKTKNAAVLLVLFILGLGANDSRTQSRENTREIMRQKLRHSQSVLEGLATENFVMIETNAARLNALSQSADWRIRQTPEYQQFTADFARQTIALEKAARRNNLDAAMLAYFQMTASCVQCHKYLRGGIEAKRDLGMPGTKIHTGD